MTGRRSSSPLLSRRTSRKLSSCSYRPRRYRGWSKPWRRVEAAGQRNKRQTGFMPLGCPKLLPELLISLRVCARLLGCTVLADTYAGIVKSPAFLGNELPGVALGRQSQLQHTVGVEILDFTIAKRQA